MRSPTKLALFAAFACAVGFSAFAQSSQTNRTVVPIGLENQQVNSNDSILGDQGHFQELFRASSLTPVWNSPVAINGVAFRLASGSVPGGALVPHIEIRFSTSTRAPEQMSLLYSVNKGLDETTVFHGDDVLLFSSAQQAVNPFDFRFTFDQPFVYDPKAGNLLMYMETTGSFSGRQIDAQGYPSLSASPASYVGTTFSDNQVAPYSLVTEFSWVAVPEPSTLSLIGLALAGLAANSLRRRSFHPLDSATTTTPTMRVER